MSVCGSFSGTYQIPAGVFEHERADVGLNDFWDEKFDLGFNIFSI